MADAAAKPEIKVDPAAPATEMKDIAAFEDDPTLEIPSGDDGAQAWLVRLPEYLWKAWAEIYRGYADDTPIEIGKMRVKKTQDPAQDPAARDIQIRLAPGVPQHRNLPPGYDVKLRSQGYNGTVVFSERESVEDAKRRSQQQTMRGAGRGIPSKAERYGKNRRDDAGGGKGQLRTTIHRNTALAPQIQHVADAIPWSGDSYHSFLKKQVANADKTKYQTTISDKIDKSLTAGGSSLGPFATFTTSSKPSATKKAPKEKAVRIPQAELLDALDKCFRTYRYWSLKALRNELHQPEAYIKQTLEQIAVLVRSGDFAMNYMLKPEYTAQYGIKDEDVKQEHKDVGTDDELEGASGSASGSGDEEEDDEAFEDVQMVD